jgi:MFS family permease
VTTQRPSHILPVIVLSQFAGTSLWFASNAVLSDIQKALHLSGTGPGAITISVQLGFIAGTFIFALLNIADRFSPTRVFFACSLAGALANAGIGWLAADTSSLMGFRFLTGFFLAGIYPVGMKIAADWYEKGLGKALSYLIGALVLGTAFPYLLKGGFLHLSWQMVINGTSLMAAGGGLLMLFLVGDGPFRKRSSGFHPGTVLRIFRPADFRAVTIGYIGHMWELYTFWAFIPVLLALHAQYNGTHHDISLWSFLTIGIGGISSVAGGLLSQKFGSGRIAFYSLLGSGICCCCCYFMMQAPTPVFLLFLLLWGAAVTPDSPQFSTLVAQFAPADNKGTALTLVTSIGFAITITSLELVGWLFHHYNSPLVFLILAIGPAMGLRALYKSSTL